MSYLYTIPQGYVIICNTINIILKKIKSLMKNFLINAAIKTVDITLYVKEGANTLTDLHRQATFTEKGRINKTPKECLITILKVWLQELEQTHNQKM